MISIQDKIMVAENCEEYKPKVYILSANITALSQGCNTCVNYVNDKCSRKLFEEIEKKIKVN